MQYKIIGELDLKKAQKRININKKDIDDAPDLLEFFKKNNFKTLIHTELKNDKKAPIRGVLIQLKDLLVLEIVKNYHNRLLFEVEEVESDGDFANQEELLKLIKKGVNL